MFCFREIESGIVRCTPSGRMSGAAETDLRQFLKAYRGRLLLDLHALDASDARQLIYRLRCYLPQTAVIGAEAPAIRLSDLKGYDFYRHEVSFFSSEEDALIWLRGEAGQLLIERVRQWALNGGRSEANPAAAQF